MSEGTLTKIPAPRVALVEERTGLISREWFRFFNNLYIITGGATQGITQIENGGTSASTAAQARANLGAGTVNQVDGSGNVNGITLVGSITNVGVLSLEGEITDVNINTQTTGNLDISTRVKGVLSIANGGTGVAAITVSTQTADFTVADADGWVINNKSGSTCTVTLPDATQWGGRQIVIKNLQAQLVVSASSNVAPIGSATPGIAILPATVGAWATLVSDGTNWIIMQS